MSNVGGRFGSRVATTSGAARLALGDLVVILGLMSVGVHNHGTNPVESPLVVVATATPFLVGWVVGALAAGAYAPGATRTIRSAVFRGVGAWLVAAAVGLTLRTTPYFRGSSPVTFALVITGTGVAALAAWRTLAAVRR